MSANLSFQGLLRTRLCLGCSDIHRCEFQHQPREYELLLSSAAETALSDFDSIMAGLHTKIQDLRLDPMLTAEDSSDSIRAVTEELQIVQAQKRTLEAQVQDLQTTLRQFDVFIEPLLPHNGGDGIMPSLLAWESKVVRDHCRHLVCRARAKLPIFAFADKLVTSVRDNAVTIVLADTGSGKRCVSFKLYPIAYYSILTSHLSCTASTQVAALLADSFQALATRNDQVNDPDTFLTPYAVCPRLSRKVGMLRHQTSEEPTQNNLRVRRMIVVTQPRKLAARSLAERVSQEWGCRVGEEIGFDCGSEKMLSDRTIIKFVTDKVLLAEAVRDPELQRYRIICVDEAHERTVDTDLLLGRLKTIVSSAEEVTADAAGHLPPLSSRCGLRVVVMSATLDPALFERFFTREINGVAKKPSLLQVRDCSPFDIYD